MMLLVQINYLVTSVKHSLLWATLFLVSRYVIDYFFAISYIHHALIFSLFLSSILLAMIYHRRDILVLIFPMISKFKLAIALTMPLIAFFLYLNIAVDTQKIAQHFPYHYFAYFDWRYSFTKSIDIFFQQYIFLMALVDLQKIYDRNKAVTLFTLLMGVMHLPTCFIFGLPFGPLFILAGMLAGWIFSTLLLERRFGICLAFALHWLFYIILGLYIIFVTLPALPPF